MPNPDYLPLSAQLPAVYRQDPDSFEQVDAYLGLTDELFRSVVVQLETLGHWLSPYATDLWPAVLPMDAGPDALLGAYRDLFDELASWVAFRFPRSWPRDAAGVEKRRDFLLGAARTWRRRGTPRGFIDWFSFAFDVAPDQRPFLVEHYKVAAPADAADSGLRATLFVPSGPQFSDFMRRREAIDFVERYAPSHVHVRVCWARPDFSLDPVPGAEAPSAEVEAYRARVRELLCSLVSFIDHANGIRIWECVDAGRSIDRLGVGKLPGGG